MGALAGVIGGSAVAQGAASYFGQQQTNSMNQDMLTQQENYNTSMADTAHQREVTDLKAAGLNPILSAGGSGAATPGVSPPTMTSPLQTAAKTPLPDPMAILQGVKDLDVKDSQEKLNEANATVATKNAGIKSLTSDVTGDADSLYNYFKKEFVDWYQKSGLNQSGAKRPNLLFGSPSTPGAW